MDDPCYHPKGQDPEPSCKQLRDGTKVLDALEPKWLEPKWLRNIALYYYNIRLLDYYIVILLDGYITILLLSRILTKWTFYITKTEIGGGYPKNRDLNGNSQYNLIFLPKT